MHTVFVSVGLYKVLSQLGGDGVFLQGLHAGPRWGLLPRQAGERPQLARQEGKARQRGNEGGKSGWHRVCLEKKPNPHPQPPS